MPIGGTATIKNEVKPGGSTNEQTGAREAKGMARITNRATLGPLSGLAFMDCVNGELFPEGAKADDESTWLQPGDSVIVDMGIAMNLCGDVWDPRHPDGRDLILYYGGYQYEQHDAAKTGR